MGVKFAVLACGVMLAALAGQAQTAADIKAMVDEKMGALDEFAALLNDPDPERSLAAMAIMIGHDDAQISRMALQYGLTSTSAPVRKAALKAYFDTGPVLNIYIDGKSLDEAKFNAAITGQSGTVDASGSGFLSVKAGAFDDAEGCYDFHTNSNYCFVTLAESNVGISLWSRWVSLTLNDEGNLTGMVQVDRLTPSVPVTIPVRP